MLACCCYTSVNTPCPRSPSFSSASWEALIFSQTAPCFFSEAFPENGQFGKKKKWRVCVNGRLSLDGVSLRNKTRSKKPSLLLRFFFLSLLLTPSDAATSSARAATHVVGVRAREHDGWDALREATGIMDVMTQRPDSSEPRNAHRDGWRHVRTLGRLSLPSTPPHSSCLPLSLHITFCLDSRLSIWGET